jgi:large subunit ribosomal protein L9
MEIILLTDVRSLGKRGEVVDVKPGYARNYLLPQGMGLEATRGNIKYFEQIRSKIDAQLAQEKEAAELIAAKLAGVRIEIAKRVGETETLYGSVTATEIGERLAERGIEVDRRKLDLEGGIKTLGDHPVRIHLHPEVAAEIIVSVVAEEV